MNAAGPTTEWDVVVIGAGAAGMMCALTAGGRGRRVLLLDHANKPGKKILMSGGGRCNFTNLHTGPENFSGENPHFCKSALARYTPWDFVALVEEHGVPYHEKKLGQLFCDRRSHDIRDLLLEECGSAGVTLHLHTAVREIEPTQPGFGLDTDLGAVRTESLVIATGGLSIPTMGATGFGYDVARRFGHAVVPTRAALVPLTVGEDLIELCRELSGTAVDAVAACNGQSFREHLLFTHRGLSGPSILQVSTFWEGAVPVDIDLLPDRDAHAWLTAERERRPDRELRSTLAEVFTRRLAQEMCERWFGSVRLRQLAPAELERVAHTLNRWTVRPAGTEGYRTAEVTFGGVDTRELSSKTMESRRQPGLHFVGEVLDVTGWLGGYNFQWAWASGHAAGLCV